MIFMVEDLKYKKVNSLDEVKKIPYEEWVLVVQKIPLVQRYDITPEKKEFYGIIKPYEGSWCLLDHNIPMRIINILEPPRWSFFSNEVDMRDWFCLGDP